MGLTLDEQVARSMEADVRILHLLPALLADLQELGTPADLIVSALRGVGLQAGATVLDLGCGKGAVAVALAERLALQVQGIDGFAPFLDAARSLAAARGVSSSCLFRKEDIRSRLGKNGRYEAVLLLSIGPISGDHRKTVGDLRTLVRPGGYIVIEDGFFADGVAGLPGCKGYADRKETRRRLTSHGDRLVTEVLCPAEETRLVNERNNALIQKRASLLRVRHPDLAEAIDEYVAGQQRETEILGADLICAVWVLQRK